MNSYIGKQEPCHTNAKHGDLYEPNKCATCGLSYDKKIEKKLVECRICGCEIEKQDYCPHCKKQEWDNDNKYRADGLPDF